MSTRMNQLTTLVSSLILAFAINGFGQLPSEGPATGLLIGKAKLVDNVAHQTHKLPNLLVSAKSGIQNVVVTVEGVEGTFKADPLQVSQKDMAYVPRISVTMAGNEVTFSNAETLLHNVRATEEEETLINVVMFNQEKKYTQKLEQPGLVDVKCDVHPGMQGYIVVTDNPFYAKTNEAGLFKIDTLPAGAYKIKAWHETLGTVEKEVMIIPGEKTAIIFEFTPKAPIQ